MSETTLTFRVDEALKTQSSTIEKQHDRTASQLLRDFMRNVVNQGAVPLRHSAIKHSKSCIRYAL